VEVARNMTKHHNVLYAFSPNLNYRKISLIKHCNWRHFYVHVGWLEAGINSLEVYDGVTSLGNVIARYTSDNFTAGDILYSSGDGLYIRLRGVFNMADKLNMVYTAVSNRTGSEYGIHYYENIR
jgi:hypothetical protein